MLPGPQQRCPLPPPPSNNTSTTHRRQQQMAINTILSESESESEEEEKHSEGKGALTQLPVWWEHAVHRTNKQKQHATRSHALLLISGRPPQQSQQQQQQWRNGVGGLGGVREAGAEGMAWSHGAQLEQHTTTSAASQPTMHSTAKLCARTGPRRPTGGPPAPPPCTRRRGVTPGAVGRGRTGELEAVSERLRALVVVRRRLGYGFMGSCRLGGWRSFAMAGVFKWRRGGGGGGGSGGATGDCDRAVPVSVCVCVYMRRACTTP